MTTPFKVTFGKEVIIGTDYSKFTREEWQEYRSNMKTIGGSEIGAVLGLDKYTSPQELFYKKLGLFQKTFSHRLPMAMGNYFEKSILELVRYHDYDEETFAINMDHKIIQHKTKEFKKTLYVPWLDGYHFNIDGLVKLNGRRRAGVLEAKYMSQFVLDMWKESLPPQYMAQAVVYSNVLGLDYAVLAFQTAAHSMNLFVVEDTKELFERWMPTLIDFNERLEKARKAIADMAETQELDEKDMYAIAGEFEPPLIDSAAAPYLSFMSERALEIEDEVSIEPDEEDMRYAMAVASIRGTAKELKDKEDAIKAYFTKRMTDGGIQKFNLGDKGSITFRKGLRFNLK